MAERTTRWKPDTCGCTVDYSWDDAVPEADLVLTCVAVELCPDHASLADQPLGVAMEAVMLHNRSARAEA